MSVTEAGDGSSAPSVAVAYSSDAARTYLYRPGQLVVGSSSQSLVAGRLRAAGAALKYTEGRLDAALYTISPTTDIPAFISEVIGEDEFAEVSPNHIFWTAEEEDEDAKPEDYFAQLGVGLVGDLLDTRPQPLPSPLSIPHKVVWVDTPVQAHPLFKGFAIPLSTGFGVPIDPIDGGSSDHGTISLGAFLLRANLPTIVVEPVADNDGFVDEFTLASVIAADVDNLSDPDVAVIFLPLGGFTHGDRPPVSLSALTERSEVVLVAAAGNHGSERPHWPAAFSGVVAVGAADNRGRAVPWSGRGPWVNSYALGAGVPTIAPPDRWVRASGTSLATATFGGNLIQTMADSGLNPEDALTTLGADRAREIPEATPTTPVPTRAEESTEQPPQTVSDAAETTAEAAETDTEPPEPPSPQNIATARSRQSTAPPRPSPTTTKRPRSAQTASRLAPNYFADSAERNTLVDERTDVLGIRGDVDVLASVIASSRISPPLSLGIFGDWGAGKSFLMTQLGHRVRQLANAAKQAKATDPSADRYYYGEICQIEFNAWQYVGGQQLWASLVSRVFEGVREHVGNDERYLDVMQRIARQDDAVQKAANDLKEAAIALKNIGEPVGDRTMAELEQANADDENVKSAVSQFTEAVRRPPEEVDVAEVQRELDELQNVSRRLRQGLRLRKEQTSPGAGVFICLLVAAVIAAVVVLPGVGRIITGVAGVLVAGLAVVTAALRSSDDVFQAGLRILGTDRRMLRRYNEAKAEHARAEAQLARLKHEGPAGLHGFVAERYRANDYRQYLGMVPLIRRDLKELDRYSREGSDAVIDRIVLYIDDLDRCPPDQVVKVLEAVNLLFGFPLFVVVIAVDSRWLLQSLEHEFSAIFRGQQSSSPTAQDYLEKIIQIPFWLRPMDREGFAHLVESMMDARNGESAEPAGLERHAAAATPATSTRVPENDVNSAQADESDRVTPPATTGPAPTAEPAIADTQTIGPVLPHRATSTQQTGQRADDSANAAEPAPSTVKAGQEPTAASTSTGRQEPPPTQTIAAGALLPAADQPIDRSPAVNMTPEALVVTPSELDYLRALAPLVSTPRATKRLVNTYQLVRVSIDDVGTFVDSGDYRAVLLLLALVTTPRGLSVETVESLLSQDDDLSLAQYSSQGVVTASTDWRELAARLEPLDVGSISVGDVRRWLSVIGRFSFNARLAGLGNAARQRRAPPTT